jgi:RNA recognition motif-containing protein
VDKSNHPYFSKLSKIRREKLAKQRENKFWDGFQWVSKESIILANKDPTKHLKKDLESGNVDLKKDEKLVTGKDLRRVVATNLPLEYGLDQEDLANYLMVKCKEKGDEIQFRSIFLNYEHNSGIIEVMEKEQTDLLIKIDGDVLFGQTLRFTKVADENGFIHGGDSENLMQDSAQLTAQAAAIVNARIRGLQGKGWPTNLNMIGESNLISTSKPSRFIKIYNAFDRYETMTAEMFEEMYEDMEEMMLQFGQFNMLKIIKNGEEKLGAEVGSVFVEFATEEEAKAAKETLKGKIYDGREVKSIFVPEEVMKNEVKITQK